MFLGVSMKKTQVMLDWFFLSHPHVTYNSNLQILRSMTLN